MTESSFGRPRRMRALMLSTLALVASQGAHGQAAGTVPAARNDTSGVVRCVDVPAGTPRPEFGCFNIAHASGLTFTDSLVVWRLYRFPSVSAAEAARSSRGSVAEAEGAAWLSEVSEAGVTPSRPAGGTLVATSAPLPLPKAASYGTSWVYGVFRTGMRSRIHVHPGPEAFYVLAGAQCLETPNGLVRTSAGNGTFLPGGVPMELTTSGSEVRRAFALIVHDASHPPIEVSAWRATGACTR